MPTLYARHANELVEALAIMEQLVAVPRVRQLIRKQIGHLKRRQRVCALNTRAAVARQSKALRRVSGRALLTVLFLLCGVTFDSSVFYVDQAPPAPLLLQFLEATEVEVEEDYYDDADEIY